MDPTVFELNGVGLRISRESLVFLGGINSEDRWNARGLSGHSMDANRIAQLDQEEKDAIDRLTGTAEGQKKIKDFAHEVKEVMRSILLGNFDWLDNYLGERQFVLLCGLHRTGGTYLLDELSTIFNFPYQKFHCMHDDLPSFFPILYWKLPHYYLPYICEFAQFLVMVNRGVPWKIIVKKRAIWTVAIESLANIFRTRLSVFVHMRHPITWAWADTEMREGKGQSADITAAGSMKQYVDVFDGKASKDDAPIQTMIRFWRLFHMESARKGVVTNVLPFGKSDAMLRAVAQKYKPGYEPSPFNPTPRDYNKYEQYFPEAQQAIDDVRRQWDERGQVFPDLDLI